MTWAQATPADECAEGAQECAGGLQGSHADSVLRFCRERVLLRLAQDPEVLEGHPVPWIGTEADPYRAIRPAGAFSR